MLHCISIYWVSQNNLLDSALPWGGRPPLCGLLSATRRPAPPPPAGRRASRRTSGPAPAAWPSPSSCACLCGGGGGNVAAAVVRRSAIATCAQVKCCSALWYHNLCRSILPMYLIQITASHCRAAHIGKTPVLPRLCGGGLANNNNIWKGIYSSSKMFGSKFYMKQHCPKACISRFLIKACQKVILLDLRIFQMVLLAWI